MNWEPRNHKIKAWINLSKLVKERKALIFAQAFSWKNQNLLSNKLVVIKLPKWPRPPLMSESERIFSFLLIQENILNHPQFQNIWNIQRIIEPFVISSVQEFGAVNWIKNKTKPSSYEWPIICHNAYPVTCTPTFFLSNSRYYEALCGRFKRHYLNNSLVF